MSFFYRRKPKPPSSTLFVPLLKLFKTTIPRKPPETADPIVDTLPVDTGSPFLLSGPKSQYGLGISLHFIIIPDSEHINTELVWYYARKEMRNALLFEGIKAAEAEMYGLRLIDPISLPPEIIVEYPDDQQDVLKDLQQAVTYQLLEGTRYTGTLESIKQIYFDLADTFISLATKKTPQSPDAATFFEDMIFENIEVVIKQVDIEKRTVVDVLGKLREFAEFFEMFSKSRYLNQATPQDPKIIQQLFTKAPK
jgi:hypothetical protein